MCEFHVTEERSLCEDCGEDTDGWMAGNQCPEQGNVCSVSVLPELLDGDDGPAAINVPVSDGDPPEEGSPVECANYDSFRAEGLTDPEDSEPPEDS